MTSLPPDWDDDRLDAAFRARAERTLPTPPDLMVEVRARVERERERLRISIGMRRASVVGAVAAAVVMAIVVGVVRPDRHDLAASPSPAPSAATVDPTPGPSPAATTPLDAALGEPVSVSEAIAIRDGSDANDRELVVEGFLSRLPAIPCPSHPTAPNPTRLGCPQAMQWLMEQPESVTDPANGDLPSGPALHPSFALVERPNVPIVPGISLPVVLVGHFHDRRAALCEPAEVAGCRATFVVDHVAVVDGQAQAVETRRSSEVVERPKDLIEDVDRLIRGVAPDAVVMSRQLVTIGQVIPLEPILAEDYYVPNIANPTMLMWITTTVDLRAGVPVARTFVLFDGTNWFAEVTAAGAEMHERRAVVDPSGDPQRPQPSGDPAAFDAAPTEILGIPVRDIATVMRDRAATMDDMGRDEFAIRAWYVAPDPAADCEPTPRIQRPTVPCDAARHWLLDRPEQYGVEVGQLRTFPERLPRVLNPILPVDVPFDVPASWVDGAPAPQPVIVLGHFNDLRGPDVFAGNRYFVLDALAWRRDHAIDSVAWLTRLTSAAIEDPATVIARINETSPHDAVVTWTTVVDGSDFAAIDPHVAEDAPEFTSGPPVWIVGRLIRGERDGRQRLAVVNAYTLDGGTRVWAMERPDMQADLATTIDIGPFGQHTREIRVFDYDEAIVSVRRATAADGLAWEPTNPERDGFVEAARGPSDREIGVRWSGATCDPDWELRIGVDMRTPDGEVWINVRGGFSDSCPVESGMVTRALMVTFDRPIELDQVRSTSRFSTGG